MVNEVRGRDIRLPLGSSLGVSGLGGAVLAGLLLTHGAGGSDGRGPVLLDRATSRGTYKKLDGVCVRGGR